MENLRVSLLQTDIFWENKAGNLYKQDATLSALAGKADLVILPEMFTTGFSMNAVTLAENEEGETIAALKKWAGMYDMAIAGSFIAREGKDCYNRGFLALPSGDICFYDKRHLFRMGDEGRFFTEGKQRLIVEYKGWKICLLVCYDLRFPVWCRNRDNEYDLLIFVASWPQSRIHTWRSLLVARAIENAAYVCGVNRVGTDGASLIYSGESLIVDEKGYILAEGEPGIEQIVSAELDLTHLHRSREKFPVWKDADDFTIKL